MVHHQVRCNRKEPWSHCRFWLFDRLTNVPPDTDKDLLKQVFGLVSSAALTKQVRKKDLLVLSKEPIEMIGSLPRRKINRRFQ